MDGVAMQQEKARSAVCEIDAEEVCEVKTRRCVRKQCGGWRRSQVVGVWSRCSCVVACMCVWSRMSGDEEQRTRTKRRRSDSGSGSDETTSSDSSTRRSSHRRGSKEQRGVTINESVKNQRIKTWKA